MQQIVQLNSSLNLDAESILQALKWSGLRQIFGKEITIETNPEPSVSPPSKQLDNLPSRILRFHLTCMDQFAYNIHYVPAKNLSTVDTLSRALLTTTIHDHDLEELAELLMSAQIDQLPASKE